MASPHVYGLPSSLHTKASSCRSYVASLICYLLQLVAGAWLAVKPTSYAFPKKKNASKGEKIDDILTWMLTRRIQVTRFA
jgi:hypothetical protein